MTSTNVNWTAHTPEELSSQDVAKHLLARLLNQKKLALLLGAGASADLGLPRWSDLVERCAKHLGEEIECSDVASSGDLMQAIDRLRRRHEVSSEAMFETVRVALYGDMAANSQEYHSFDFLRNPLLSALGALMMASARGSAGEVFTLNFDDVLEWYLDLHGFRTEVVSELPTTLRGDVDVHVFHIHGFVPLSLDRYAPSSWLILSQSELEARLAKDASDPWETLLLNRLQSKMFLAIGTSMSDTDVKVSLNRARNSVVDRPLGFVLGTHNEDKIGELREANLIPVAFEDHEEIPYFVLEVCQLAAAASEEGAPSSAGITPAT